MNQSVSQGFVCRNCQVAGHYGFHEEQDWSAAPVCPSCASPRVVFHAELFSLTMAHIDCDAFYCSVEKRDNPDLRGKPVIVSGGERGVVAAACYVARQFGIRSAMPTWRARKACADLVIIKPRMAHYQLIGKQIRQMMLSLTPLVQPLSIDEAFLDLSGTEKLHRKTAAEALVAFQAKVRAEIGVSVSVGLAPNKSMAKIASDQDKPDGFYAIGQAESRSWLCDKPVKILFGLGQVTSRKLNAAGLHTCADITSCPPAKLEGLIGRDARRVQQLASGIDPRGVETSRDTKSISSETTFTRNIASLPDLLSIADGLVQTVSRRLKDSQLQATRVHLKLKQPNHRILSRSASLQKPTQMAHRLFEVASSLIEKEAAPHKFWRLLGIGVSVIQVDQTADSPFAGTEANLFEEQKDALDKRKDKLEKAIDDVHKKLGAEALTTGRRFSFEARKQKHLANKKLQTHKNRQADN